MDALTSTLLKQSPYPKNHDNTPYFPLIGILYRLTKRFHAVLALETLITLVPSSVALLIAHRRLPRILICLTVLPIRVILALPDIRDHSGCCGPLY